MDPIIQVLLTMLTSFLVSFFSIPSVIKVAELKNLHDEPDLRKKHLRPIPTLGGVSIFASFIFTTCFLSNQVQIMELQYIISALLIMFFMGIKDDIVTLVPYKKLTGQLIASVILVILGGIKFSSFYGIFGIYDISNIVSIPFSILVIVFITNSINLIDGIDTLAGSIGVLANLFFGTWFFLTENYHYSVLSFAMLGSLVGFLFYNKTPAKIFMGDTGSLTLGLVLSILSIKFIELNRIYTGPEAFKVLSAPTVAISVLILPLFDTLRVFILRILRGKSPLSPDREHIHHILIDSGLSHIKASTYLIVLNIFSIAWTCFFMRYNAEFLLVLNFVTLLIFIKLFSRKKTRSLTTASNENHPLRE